MTLEEIKIAIPKLIKFFKKIPNWTLFGGEPLLNPQYKEICQYLREVSPNSNISIFTNGLILSNFNKKDFDFFKNFNIKLKITLYPLPQYIHKIEEKEKIMREKNIQYTIEGCRPFFAKGGYNLNGSSDSSRFFSCCHCSWPLSFYLYKNRLYRCAISIRITDLGIPFFKEDSILIDDLNETLFKSFCSKPLKLCNYCNTEMDYSSDEIIIWHQQKDLQSDYTHNLKDLYINNYDLYWKYVHDCSVIKNLFNDEYFLSAYNNYNDGLPSNPFQSFLIRFKSGLADVFIPYSKDSIANTEGLYYLRNLIFNQKNYKLFNFYFVSTDQDKKTKDLMYLIFRPMACDLPANFFLLQGNGINDSYNEFLKNSYLQQKIIINNYKNLLNSNYLIDQYEINGGINETI